MGWIYATGPNPSVGTPKTLIGIHVTAHAFWYLLVADTRGILPNPGGALGTLCVFGAGRYVHQLGHSGGLQRFDTTVDPLSIPQPTGFQAIAPGETWYFQYWHRDMTPTGSPTSNFTNALQITFMPCKHGPPCTDRQAERPGPTHLASSPGALLWKPPARGLSPEARFWVADPSGPCAATLTSSANNHVAPTG